MMLLLWGLAATVAQAASLDNLEIGGMWGSPTLATPAAVWWNPAALSAEGGHQLLIEAAPTFASIQVQRADPHAADARYSLRGTIPFLGLSSDLGVEGLGLGLALSVPVARGGTAEDAADLGGTRYHMRDGQILSTDLALAARYAFRDLVGVGVGVHRVDSSWSADLDLETMTDLYDEIQRQGLEPDPDVYTDANLEDPRYAASLNLGPLRDVAWSWSLGLWGRPHPRVEVGLSWMAGLDLDHRGEGTVALGCPPEDDEAGRFGSEAFGLCDADLDVDASVGYALPSRLHLGVAVHPLDQLRLEAFGGWVGWARFEDFIIDVSGVDEKNDVSADAARLVEQHRLWARDNRNTFFVALDARGQLGERWTLAGRVMFDRAAVNDRAVSMNNLDANDTILSGLAAFRPLKPLQIGLGLSQHLLAPRIVEDSGYGMTIDPDSRNPDRWFYPHASGTYRVSITRLSASVSLKL